MSRTRRHRLKGWRGRAAVLVSSALIAAACSSGESILDAGLSPETVPVPPTAGPDGSVPTTIPATTTTTPLADLPPCPQEALEEASGTVELTFWHAMTNELEDALVELTDGYNASQDQVRVTLQNQGGYNEAIDKYFQSGVGGRPEIVQMPEYMVQQVADSESTVPIGACMEDTGFDDSAFLPRALNAYQTGGVQWSMPFNVSNPILYYNKTMFEEAGLDPEKPPQTLTELRQYSQQIVDSGAAGFGIAFDTGQDNGGGWFLEQWFAKGKELFADNANGRSAPATQVMYNNDFGVELLTEVQSLVADGLAVNVGANPSGQDSFLKLADRENPAAMTIGTSAALGTIKVVLDGGLIPDLTSEQLGIGPMPGPDEQPGVLVGGASLHIVADKGDDVAAASWDYIQHLVTAEAQSLWAARTGYVPVRTDALDLQPLKRTYNEDPRFKVAYDQLTASSDDPSSSGPVLGPLREVRAVNADAVSAIFGGADVADALEEAAGQSNRLIRNYNARN
ncbi:MAG: ABC transporter substrate-binding protein [Actinomycetota bacterium]|nr:ABC transporter substrate-binding protein [Actinomycetota bacterium]